MGDCALETSIFLMKIVFAKCKNAKIFRLRRATNAKATINMNKRHIYYLNVVFSARRRRKKIGVFSPLETPPTLVTAHFQTIFFSKDVSWSSSQMWCLRVLFHRNELVFTEIPFALLSMIARLDTM